MSDVVQQLWGFCHTLRHDGIDYGDYIEQLTYLLFLLSQRRLRKIRSNDLIFETKQPTVTGDKVRE